MLRPWHALAAVAFAAAPALAQETHTYRMEGQVDWRDKVDVELVITERDGGVVVTRTARDRAGAIKEVLLGAGQRVGQLLRVQLIDQRGARGSLLGEATLAPVFAIYKLLPDGSAHGLLYDAERRWGWRFTSERGAREVAITPEAAGPEAYFQPAGQLPFKRVVLCLDGIPYTVLSAMHAQGHFKDFSAPGRMISVYPSLSSIAWSSLLGLPAEPGYQAVFYANALGKNMGVTARKMQGSRFQTRMHHRHTGIVGHGLAYVAPVLMGKRQLKHMLEELLEHRGSRTAFLYAYQTDPIAHMEGREALEDTLRLIDAELQKLQAGFQKRYGEKLEIVIVSDHGHTLVSGELVKLEKHLERHGWKMTKEIRGPRQASFTTAGILSSVALHTQEAQEPELAQLVAGMAGVDVCTYDIGGRQQYVVAQRGVARFDYDPDRNAYAYQVLEGQDPLGYRDVYAALAAAGKLTADGYATSRDVFEATAQHTYPDAPARIRRGHGSLVRNPANVIVSLRPGFENGAGMVKLTASLRGRSGTHGGLDQVNSAGVFMTNYRPTVPAIRTRDFGAYVDLRDYLENDPPAEISVAPSGEVADGPAPEYGVDRARDGMWLEVRDAKLSPDLRTSVHVVVKRSRFLLRDKQVFEGRFGAEALRRDGETWQVDLGRVLPKLEEGKTYVVDVTLERHDAAGELKSRDERRIKVRWRGTYEVFD